MRVGIQDIAEQLLVLLARAALGLFLSATIGAGLYIVIALPIAHSFWEVSDIDFSTLAVLVIGLGAGVGGFLAWLDRDLTLSATLIMLLLAVALSLVGAWIGLQESRDVYKMVGQTGSPALTRIIIGAMLGGNIFNLTFWILKIVRNPRI